MMKPTSSVFCDDKLILGEVKVADVVFRDFILCSSVGSGMCSSSILSKQTGLVDSN